MIYNERDLRQAQALDIAQKMCVAARTAPKGKGVDIVECAVADGDEQERIACAMEAIGEECGHKFFLRDADYRVDTRIMFSAGVAAEHLGLLGEDVGQVYAIPVSISSKSPFFDRG